MGGGEEEMSHIFGKDQGQAEPFPCTPRSMHAGFNFLSLTHRKHFMLDQIASLPVTTPYSDKALSSPGLTS